MENLEKFLSYTIPGRCCKLPHWELVNFEQTVFIAKEIINSKAVGHQDMIFIKRNGCCALSLVFLAPQG